MQLKIILEDHKQLEVFEKHAAQLMYFHSHFISTVDKDADVCKILSVCLHVVSIKWFHSLVPGYLACVFIFCF